MDQAERVIGPVQHELAIHRQRLAEPALLERQVAQQFQRVIAPGAAECLVHHPAEQCRIARGSAPRDTSARPGCPCDCGRSPWLRAGASPATGGSGPSGRRTGRIHRPGSSAPLLLGELGDLVPVLVDDPLIEVDRLGPLAVPGDDWPRCAAGPRPCRSSRDRTSKRRDWDLAPAAWAARPQQPAGRSTTRQDQRRVPASADARARSRTLRDPDRCLLDRRRSRIPSPGSLRCLRCGNPESMSTWSISLPGAMIDPRRGGRAVRDSTSPCLAQSAERLDDERRKNDDSGW